MTGRLRGRPRDTAELNHALIARLASEVQGFSRDLHDESIDFLLGPAHVPDPALRVVFRISLERKRALDSGNANSGNIGNDFAMFGLRLWNELGAGYPTRSGQWNRWLEWLNLARNGIAHNDAAKIAEASSQHPLTLATFRQTRRVLSQFAGAMDRVVGAYLTTTTGTRPW